MLFYTTSCVVSVASIGIHGWLLADKLRSRHRANNRVGAVPHFALGNVRRASLRESISLTPGASILQEKFEASKMKRVKYLLLIAQVRRAEHDRTRRASVALPPPCGAERRGVVQACLEDIPMGGFNTYFVVRSLYECIDPANDIHTFRLECPMAPSRMLLNLAACFTTLSMLAFKIARAQHAVACWPTRLFL